MKKFLKFIFHLFGLEVNRLQPQKIIRIPVSTPGVDSMLAGLKRAKDRYAVMPFSVIDLGAAEGTWSLKTLECWPNAKYILFEPLSERKEIIRELCSKHSNFYAVHAAAGGKSGKINFMVSEDLDGSGVYNSEIDGVGIEVEQTTIDEEMRKLNLNGPYVIKFDTHGYEVPILEGAKESLKNTQLVIMECYGFKISHNSLLLHEMCLHMEKYNFRLADVVDIMRRNHDGLFWQCDVFFLPKNHHSFRSNSYSN